MEKATGTWWKFSQYEVREGFIRPAEGASLEEYDPWLDYWERLETKVTFPPCSQLTQVVRDVPRAQQSLGAPVERSRELEHEVLEWCRKYGLLGLLPHTVLSARLGGWGATRSPGGWIRSLYLYDPDQEFFARIIVQEIDASDTQEWPGDAWYRYFPDVPKDQWQREQPRLPLSKEFWEEYGEPFHYFVRVARFFANALAVFDAAPDHEVREYPDRVLDREEALERLNGLAAGVRTVVALDDQGRYLQNWKSPSLLGHLAMQAAQDLLKDRRLVTCRCGVTVSTMHPRAKYCSERCANRYRKQRSRKGREA